MQNWLDHMGDWYSSCQTRTVVDTVAKWRERALKPEAVDTLPELNRQWIDGIQIACPQCGTGVERVTEGDDC